MAPAGSARIVEALGISSGRAKSRRPGAPLETQPHSGFYGIRNTRRTHHPRGGTCSRGRERRVTFAV
eukprot:4538608-Prymnesium_polylepis.1